MHLKHLQSPLCLSLLLSTGCVEPKSLGSLDETGTAASGEDSGAEVTDGVGDDGDGSTTGAPAGCFDGEEPGEALWSASYQEIMADWNTGYEVPGPMVLAQDGRVVMATYLGGEGKTGGPGLTVLGADGAFLDRIHAPLTEGGMSVNAMAIGDDGRVYTLGRGTAEHPRLERYAADLTPLGPVELDLFTSFRFDYHRHIAAGDLPVVTAEDPDTGALRVAKVDPNTGATVWSAEVSDAPVSRIMALTVGPGGEVVVAVQEEWDKNVALSFTLLALAPDGAPLWARLYDVPDFAVVTDLEVTPTGQIVVLRNGPGYNDDTTADLMAVELADGDELWSSTLATTVDEVRPWVNDMIVDGDRIRVPVMRTDRLAQGEPTDTRVLSVIQVSLTGEPQGEVPLSVPTSSGSGRTDTLRGACGELMILLDRGDYPFVQAFAP